MLTLRSKYVGCLLAVGLTLPLFAGPISFSGQFDPSLATVSNGGGSGWWDASAAPASITLWGSDGTAPGTEQAILTLVTWTLTTPVTNLSFGWSYITYDDGPDFDPAGYYLNGVLFQLSDDSGDNSQSGVVWGLNLSSGDVFGFYVYSEDDTGGPAGITITGAEAVIPEPGTLALLALGLPAIALLRRSKRR